MTYRVVTFIKNGKFMKDNSSPVVIMLCTAARGGMRTVVESYDRDGLFDKWNVRLLYTHDEGSVLKRLWMFLRSMLAFLYLLVFKNVRMVHVHSAMRGSFWRKNFFSAVARFFSIPVLLHLHGSEMEKFYYSQSGFFRRRISAVFLKADMVIVLSKSWKGFILKISPKANVEIVHNYVVPPTEVADIESGNPKIKLLFLGLIGERKGVYDLIRAIPKVVAKHPNLEMLIGGNGELEKARLLVEQLSLGSHVTFLGWVNGEQKLNYIRDADVYILPSHNEGLPMSILEAMSFGKPIVSTHVGGIPELVRNHKDGILIEAGNVEEIADALITLCQSPGMRLEYGDSARTRVIKDFSDKTIIPQLNDIYESIGKKGK